MNFKAILLGAAALLTFTVLNAQERDWVDMMHDPSANFFDVQDSYNEYVKKLPNGEAKGTGWKQYKRWEYYWQSRIDENGNRQEPGKVLTEMEAYVALKAGQEGYTTLNGNWQELGPVALPANGTGQPNGNGRISAIAFHPTNTSTVYAGAASGGFWKSTDGGTTWTNHVTGLTRLGVSSIVLDPTNPNIIYIGTGDRDGGDVPGYGVWRSTDGGLTWAPRNSGMGNRTVYEILMDPTNSNTLIASTNSNIYRSTNGGASWTLSFSGHNCKDIAMKPGDPNYIYATGTRVYRSINNGASFTQITSGVPSTNIRRIAVGVSPAQPNSVFLFVANSSGSAGFEGIFKSTNSGGSYALSGVNSPNILGYDTNGGSGNQAWYDLVMQVDPNNADIIYCGAINIWKTTDAGANWTLSGHWTGSGGADDVHADQHVLEWNPHDGNLYAGHDGGIHITSDAGVVWNEVTSGLGIAQVYKIGVSQQSETVINGYQDNGTGIWYDGAWITEIGGDGMECIIDPTDDNYMYGALYYGSIRRSTNNGTSFGTVAANGVNGITESGGWITPYKLDPNDPNTMFVGYRQLWKTTSIKGTPAFTAISSFSNTGSCVDVAIAPSNSNILYVSKSGSTANDDFFMSPDGGTTWNVLDANLATTSTVKDIEIHPTNSSKLWIAQGNEIYQSTNGGTSFTLFSGSLPNISLNTIVFDKDSPSEGMYVGMDVGVYYRDNTLSDWVPFSTGIPNVEVTELEIHNNTIKSCENKLYAATYGRGLWVSDLYAATGTPDVCFDASTEIICAGSSVLFMDNSSYNPTSWVWSASPNTITFINGTSSSSQNPEIQFNANGTYTITLTASNASGSDTQSETNMITANTSVAIPTMNEDFESYALCATTNNCEGTSCVLSGSAWVNANNATEDDIDWRVDEGGTPSSGTGPSVDFSEGTSTGNYIYLEASGSCSNRTALLESPCFFLNVNHELTFAYHMSGTAMGILHIDLDDGTGWQLDACPPIVGDQGTSWVNKTFDLTPWTGEYIRLRFRGVSGSSWSSDIALDQISIAPSAVLPTVLTKFDGFHIPNTGNQLEWTIEENDINEYFQLERLDKNQLWKPIHTTSITNAASYSFLDQNPISGSNYYRLGMVRVDGEITYSNVVEIASAQTTKFSIRPTLVDEELFLDVLSARTKTPIVTIVNALGFTVDRFPLHVEKGNSTFTVSVKHFSAGTYFVLVNEETFKIVKK